MTGTADETNLGSGPQKGYFGTNRVRSGREIPIPRLFLTNRYLTVGDELVWGVDDRDCPVFALDRTYLKRDWKTVGTQSIRQDHDTPVIQIPGQFFRDFTGNPQLPEEVRQKPVREAARVTERTPFHFIRTPRRGGAYIQLLTWNNLAELPAERINGLFPELDQRIEFLSTVTYEDCTEYAGAVFDILEHLFGSDVEIPIDHDLNR